MTKTVCILLWFKIGLGDHATERWTIGQKEDNHLSAKYQAILLLMIAQSLRTLVGGAISIIKCDDKRHLLRRRACLLFSLIKVMTMDYGYVNVEKDVNKRVRVERLTSCLPH